jgi:hypothetical protein
VKRRTDITIGSGVREIHGKTSISVQLVNRSASLDDECGSTPPHRISDEIVSKGRVGSTSKVEVQ